MFKTPRLASCIERHGAQAARSLAGAQCELECVRRCCPRLHKLIYDIEGAAGYGKVRGRDSQAHHPRRHSSVPGVPELQGSYTKTGCWRESFLKVYLRGSGSVAATC